MVNHHLIKTNFHKTELCDKTRMVLSLLCAGLFKTNCAAPINLNNKINTLSTALPALFITSGKHVVVLEITTAAVGALSRSGERISGASLVKSVFAIEFHHRVFECKFELANRTFVTVGLAVAVLIVETTKEVDARCVQRRQLQGMLRCVLFVERLQSVLLLFVLFKITNKLLNGLVDPVEVEKGVVVDGVLHGADFAAVLAVWQGHRHGAGASEFDEIIIRIVRVEGGFEAVRQRRGLLHVEGCTLTQGYELTRKHVQSYWWWNSAFLGELHFW